SLGIQEPQSTFERRRRSGQRANVQYIGLLLVATCALRRCAQKRASLGDRLLMEPELNAAVRLSALTRILRLHSVLNKLTAFDGSAHWESPELRDGIRRTI
uniref:IS4 family transposase n=1 Tax=Macrostomum lignano TaxID=282301 RepID=A0A1I8FDN2_9PLAT